MFTMLTVIRKRPEISTEQFRHFMEFEYGPTYAALPQTREYVQYYLADATADGAEEPIDAIVRISFDSPERMREALVTDSYKKAHAMRQAYLRETSVGIHPAVVEKTVALAGGQRTPPRRPRPRRRRLRSRPARRTTHHTRHPSRLTITTNKS